MAAHLRWAEAMNDRQWGWRVAMTHHASAERLPASLRDPHIRRAYRYLQGDRDEQMAMAHALKASPKCKNLRQVLQGFLCARDISLDGIALQLELSAEVVRLFEALFFNVRERGDGFRASVLFPETRLGAGVEAEKDFDDLDRTLMRVGRGRGWREVARMAGLISMEDADESSETMLADMERTIAANARMLALAGHLNRKDSPGIRHGKTLMMRPKPEVLRPQTDDDKVGLGSFGMKAPVLEYFRRIAEPDVQHRLALQRQRLMREQEAESRAAAKQQWQRCCPARQSADDAIITPAWFSSSTNSSFWRRDSSICPVVRASSFFHGMRRDYQPKPPNTKAEWPQGNATDEYFDHTAVGCCWWFGWAVIFLLWGLRMRTHRTFGKRPDG